MNDWTPGPWAVVDGAQEGSIAEEVCVVYCCGSYPFGSARVITLQAAILDARYRERRQANARLIAAAPDLYEALAECLEGIELCTPDAPEPMPDSIIGKARAALAKARGEQP